MRLWSSDLHVCPGSASKSRASKTNDQIRATRCLLGSGTRLQAPETPQLPGGLPSTDLFSGEPQGAPKGRRKKEGGRRPTQEELRETQFVSVNYLCAQRPGRQSKFKCISATLSKPRAAPSGHSADRFDTSWDASGRISNVF